jgi:hypothetical protein
MQFANFKILFCKKKQSLDFGSSFTILATLSISDESLTKICEKAIELLKGRITGFK